MCHPYYFTSIVLPFLNGYFKYCCCAFADKERVLLFLYVCFFLLCRRSIGINAVHMHGCSVVLICLKNLLLFSYLDASSLEIALYISMREKLRICNCVPLPTAHPIAEF